MMNIQELATAAEHQLDVKIILINNQALGLVHQQQTLFLMSVFMPQPTLIKRILFVLLKDLGWIHVI